MIKDANGDELTYWPISGLIEGENSEVLEFTVEHTGVGVLISTLDARARVWAKKVGDVSYVNISVTPYDMSGIPAGDVDFLCYVEALTPITGLERVPISVTAGTGTNAGWRS